MKRTLKIRLPCSLADARKALTLATLARCKNNISKTARVLGVSRRALQTWLSAWGARPEEESHVQ